MPTFETISARLLLCFALLGSTLSVADERVQHELQSSTEIVPPLRKALGDKAYAEAMDSGEYNYIGNLKCRLCHREFFVGRKHDAHESAYRKLLSDPYTDNPRCLSCHTTGHGNPGGFISMRETPNLANVQCEGCHGPGNQHMQRNAAGGFLAGKDNSHLLKKMCLACHASPWNKSFSNLDAAYEKYKKAKPDIR